MCSRSTVGPSSSCTSYISFEIETHSRFLQSFWFLWDHVLYGLSNVIHALLLLYVLTCIASREDHYPTASSSHRYKKASFP